MWSARGQAHFCGLKGKKDTQALLLGGKRRQVSQQFSGWPVPQPTGLNYMVPGGPFGSSFDEPLASQLLCDLDQLPNLTFLETGTLTGPAHTGLTRS